jgi:S1-C subfamily serine protease
MRTSNLRSLVVALALLAIDLPAKAEGPSDINTILMRSTFKITGGGSTGTAFIMGRPDSADPTKSFFVLITAAHVLNEMKTDDAVLFLRRKDAELFKKLPFSIKIRNKGAPLWTSHPEADVAVMYVRLPKEADLLLISSDLLATDAMLEQFGVHPGDRLSCLGYPLGAEGNDAGFPILRTGYIASYPLTPAKKVKVFLFDFNVFPGNSGGPVYFVDHNRAYGGATYLGTTVQFLAGLVSAQQVMPEEIKSLGETRQLQHQLGLGVVIPASLIREAVERLPAPPKD